MLKSLNKFLLASTLLLMLATQNGRAEDLTNSAVFHRCYAQLTQSRVPLNSALLAQVKSGQKNAIVACLEVLDSAKFLSPGYTQINATNTMGKDVLRTMHHLHASWFEYKEFIAVAQLAHAESTRAALDATAPAAYYTRALFNPTAKLRDIVISTENLSPVRTNMTPTVAQIPPLTYQTFPADFKFAPVGDILGVYNRAAIKNSAGDVSANYGGGILGNQAYLMLTVNGPGNFRADGAVKMPRNWGKAVYNDLLCRSLPAVRQEDGVAFVDTAATGQFRRAASCVHCHASMDRMSAVIRNFNYHIGGGGDNQSYGIYASDVFKARNETAIANPGEWVSVARYDYARTSPATGYLYYRNYKGDLINTKVGNIVDLGNKIAETDDLYICTAKRYYEYFMGVSAKIGDLNDPNNPIALSAIEQKHRDIVISLGLKLKTHQSTRETIAEILRMPAYRKSNFNRGSP